MNRIAAALTVSAVLLAGARARAQSSEPGGAPAPIASDPAPSTSAAPASPSPEPTCDATSSSDRCACRSRCNVGSCSSCSRSSCACHHTPSLSLSIMGVRPSLTRVSTSGSTTNDAGVAFAGSTEIYALDGASHNQLQWVLGGGEAGLEGMLAGAIELGYRLDVTDRQGPFGRAAFDGRLQGNDSYYYSALELPRLSLGWQFLSGRTVLEIGARGGPILTGRFNPGATGKRSTTGSLEYGGFVSAQVEFLRAEATVMRIDARRTGNGTPVDVGRASLCGVASKVGICADFTVMRGDANFGPVLGTQEALATYGGITVGVASW